MPFLVPPPPPPIDKNHATAVVLTSRCSGSPLATRIWRPSSGRVVAVAVLVHAHGWQAGYFEGLAGRLNRDDIMVVAYDQVGQGYSHKAAGANKPHIVRTMWSHWVHDVLAAAAWALQQVQPTQQQPSTGKTVTPLFLVGESLGGVQVLAAGLDKRLQRRYHVTVSGVVILGALLEINPALLPSKPVMALLHILSKCCPAWPVPARVNFKAASLNEACFGNREWAETARLDSVVPSLDPCPAADSVASTTPLATAAAIWSCGPRIAQRARQWCDNVPLLAMHATHDPRAGCEAVMQFVDQTKGRCVTGVWLEDATGHLLLQDFKSVTETVKNKIATWMVAQCITT
jgi:alpha-beta hydrolase superfamily lysophospholipase